MGILYLDEAGNTGLGDQVQAKMFYGGPLITSPTWNGVSHDLLTIQNKFKALILSRFTTGLGPNLAVMESGVAFLSRFEFHACDIINRKSLWSKLKEVEKFDPLNEVIDLLQKYNMYFYIGVVDKVPLRSSQTPMIEYHTLLPQLYLFIEEYLCEAEEILTIIDNGNVKEKDIVRDVIQSTGQKSLGELIIGSSLQYPLLQIADIGVWIVQAHERLSASRTDTYALQVRALYNKLASNLRIIRVN